MTSQVRNRVAQDQRATEQRAERRQRARAGLGWTMFHLGVGTWDLGELKATALFDRIPPFSVHSLSSSCPHSRQDPPRPCESWAGERPPRFHPPVAQTLIEVLLGRDCPKGIKVSNHLTLE